MVPSISCFQSQQTCSQWRTMVRAVDCLGLNKTHRLGCLGAELWYPLMSFSVTWGGHFFYTTGLGWDESRFIYKKQCSFTYKTSSQELLAATICYINSHCFLCWKIKPKNICFLELSEGLYSQYGGKNVTYSQNSGYCESEMWRCCGLCV